MAQAVSSGLTELERSWCVSDLERANREERGDVHRSSLGSLYIPVLLLIWGFLEHGFTTYPALAVMSALGIAGIVAASYGLCRLGYHWMARRTQEHARPLFLRTHLMPHIFSLATDEEAYGGLYWMKRAGEWRTRDQNSLKLHRRIKAVYNRFGYWSARFSHPLEPWPLRLAPYLVLAVACVFGVLLVLIACNIQFRADDQDWGALEIAWFWAVMMAVLIPFEALERGKRTGLRLALIDYFTAESQAGAAAETAAPSNPAQINGASEMRG